MGMRSAWLAVGCALALGCGCASGDGGTGDEDAGGNDAGQPDAGRTGDGLVCETCESHGDCSPGHYCAALATGGSVCLAQCNIDLPDCAPRFECVMNFTSDIPEPVCAPV